MKFIDEVSIDVKAGDGGNGLSSFRRLKNIPKGGPDGGDGGHGGNIIFRSVNNLNTLSQFRFQRKFEAQNGKRGGSQNKTGSDGVERVNEMMNNVAMGLTNEEIDALSEYIAGLH